VPSTENRAHAVDFDALTAPVLAGRLKAAIDIFPREPPPPDHRIRRAPNAVLAAHRAGSVPGWMRAIGTMVADNLGAILRGLPPQRLHVAQPEFVARYTASRAPRR
jgi:phosphoglycerate dehydrogenase-like enzyme